MDKATITRALIRAATDYAIAMHETGFSLPKSAPTYGLAKELLRMGCESATKYPHKSIRNWIRTAGRVFAAYNAGDYLQANRIMDIAGVRAAPSHR